MQNADWGDRRHPCRWEAETGDAGFWMPDRSEIVTQFFTRYLFFSLAVIYFSTLETVTPVLFSIEHLLIALGVYFLLNSWFFHQALQGVTLLKIRSAMAVTVVDRLELIQVGKQHRRRGARVRLLENAVCCGQQAVAVE